MSARKLGARRHLEVLHELEALNARIDDLVGLTTSQCSYCSTADEHAEHVNVPGWNQDVDGETIGAVVIPHNVWTTLVPGVSVKLNAGCNVPAHYRIAGLPTGPCP